MDLGLAAEHCTGSRVFKRWWEQHCLDLDEIRMAAWYMEWMEEGEEKDETLTETD